MEVTGAPSRQRATAPGGQDDAGNRLPDIYRVGRENRLLSDGTHLYYYDGEGNLQRRVESGPGITETFVWDSGRLLRMTKTNSALQVMQQIDYGHDALGRQSAKKSTTYTTPGNLATGTTTQSGFVYDGNRLEFEIGLGAGAGAGKIKTHYAYGPDGQIDAVDQEGRTLWMFADASRVIRSIGFAEVNIANGTTTDWKILHREYDEWGKSRNFARADGTPGSVYRGNALDAQYLKDAPQFFQGARWDADVKLFNSSGRWYDPVSGRYTSDDGSPNGYQYGEGDPVRPRYSALTKFSNADYNQIYGTGVSGAFNYFVGEGTRSAVGNDRLARASDTQLLVGTTLVAGGVVLGGYGTAYAIAAGTSATGVGVGGYLGSQAGLSAVETGLEIGLTWAFGGQVTAGSAASSFAKNFAVNSITGGFGGGATLLGKAAGYAGRQASEIGADTALDVAHGSDLRSSLLINAVGSIGGELAFKALGRAYNSQLSHQAFAYARGFERGYFSVSAGPVYLGSVIGGAGGMGRRLQSAHRMGVEEAMELGSLSVTTRYRAGATKAPDHHLFPQELRSAFARRGLRDIDKFLVRLDEGVHQALHFKTATDVLDGGFWNNEFFRRMMAKEAESGPLSRREILRIGAQMRRDYIPGTKLLSEDS